jgi:hypothetical protein
VDDRGNFVITSRSKDKWDVGAELAGKGKVDTTCIPGDTPFGDMMTVIRRLG